MLSWNEEMMLCPRNTRSSSKSKRFVVMKKVNPYQPSVKNCTYHKAHFYLLAKPRYQLLLSMTSAHTYTPAEFDALVRRLQKAEHKLSIIQLSGYLSKVPLQDKLATLEHFHNEMSDFVQRSRIMRSLWMYPAVHSIIIFSRRADRSKYESEKAQLMLKSKIRSSMIANSGMVLYKIRAVFGWKRSAHQCKTSLVHYAGAWLAQYSHRREKGLQEPNAKKMQNSAPSKIYHESPKSSMGERYYLLQNQKCMGLSLRYYRPLLP